jgi:hypothetical protein
MHSSRSVSESLTSMPMSEDEIVNKEGSMYRYQLLPRPLLSSTGLGWKGLVVERYQFPPCELPVAHHIVEFAALCPQTIRSGMKDASTAVTNSAFVVSFYQEPL